MWTIWRLGNPVLGLSEARAHGDGVKIKWDQILIPITVMLILF